MKRTLTKGERLVAEMCGDLPVDGYPVLTEAHPFLQKVTAFMERQTEWIGTVTDLLAGGIPEELLLASLNAMEFASLERPGSLPDGVLDAIYAATGWLHTGDLAREDEDGYYYMVGRKKNLIILGTGENVSPEELERKLNACPEVQECVVKEMGKRIGVLICCAEEKQAEVRAFITGLNRTLPLYQRITAVEFSTEPLPRNALGKLLRK